MIHVSGSTMIEGLNIREDAAMATPSDIARLPVSIF
jgi:hypothetical protein